MLFDQTLQYGQTSCYLSAIGVLPVLSQHRCRINIHVSQPRVLNQTEVVVGYVDATVFGVLSQSMVQSSNLNAPMHQRTNGTWNIAEQVAVDDTKHWTDPADGFNPVTVWMEGPGDTEETILIKDVTWCSGTSVTWWAVNEATSSGSCTKSATDNVFFLPLKYFWA